MSGTNILLVEISHETAPSLYLMSGRDFEKLRQNPDGRDVYGVVHEEKEYLLFPLAFEKHADGVLALRMPACDDHLFSDRDGHRVTFKSPQGDPYFSFMPEEYHTSTGILRLDADNKVTVELDRLR